LTTSNFYKTIRFKLFMHEVLEKGRLVWKYSHSGSKYIILETDRLVWNSRRLSVGWHCKFGSIYQRIFSHHDNRFLTRC
jgi:hypothetical protein